MANFALRKNALDMHRKLGSERAHEQDTQPDPPATRGRCCCCRRASPTGSASVDACVALTTYQAGRLFFIGRKSDGGIRAHERLIEQCQGLWTDGQALWTSGLYMLWRAEAIGFRADDIQREISVEGDPSPAARASETSPRAAG